MYFSNPFSMDHKLSKNIHINHFLNTFDFLLDSIPPIPAVPYDEIPKNYLIFAFSTLILTFKAS